MFKLVELACVHMVRELVKEFDERSELLNSGFNLGSENLDVIFTLDFLEVN
jgi:hypothetical protein